ncbi:hypothetical protein SYK_11990 [Pseudodesulfovibrio nedwellii]|uniref:SPOR domain-containing protein n=1 Tax=Pseudodesulfovibrio nedwellii TaxID=2973072 RepID=A0ABM8AZD3_9BACT|nr:hypothetical protein SYK_11990 [Pseudodesulfovibrio nedwellii]
MIEISTAYSSGFKVYSSVTVEDIEDLKKKLVESGHGVVSLIRVSPWDDSWSYVKSDIPVGEISDADITWLNKCSNSLYSDSRYLKCKLVD